MLVWFSTVHCAVSWFIFCTKDKAGLFLQQNELSLEFWNDFYQLSQMVIARHVTKRADNPKPRLFFLVVLGHV